MKISRTMVGAGVVFGALACSSKAPGPGAQDGMKPDALPDGAPASGTAGQCINGSASARRGGTFSWGEVVVCESQGAIEIRLPRPPEYPDGEVRLWHEVAKGSVARADGDFEGGSGRFTWPDGDTEDKVFSLTIRDDNEVEGDELLELHLHRYAGDGYWNSYGERMRILIVDDDVDNASQPFLVANIQRGKTESSQLREKVAFGGALYFSADDGIVGRELWRSDGSPSGTVRVADLLPGPEGSGPTGFRVAGDRLYFTATTETHGGAVLLRSDGTSDGTVAISESGATIDAQNVVAGESGIYFVMGNALWHADNARAPQQLFEFATPPAELVASGDVAYFAASDGVSGVELWRSDGTPDGTRLVADIVAGPEDSSPNNLIVLNGKVLFDAIQGPGLSTRQYYVSDGSPAGTIGLGTFNYASSLTLSNAVVAADRVFFTHFPVSYRGTLWVTDGTEAGTRRLREFRSVSSLSAIGRDLYFSGNDDEVGHEPWKSDGTPDGTVLLADLNPTDSQSTASKSSDPREFFSLGSKVYFTARSADSARTLWRTNGTSEGTLPLAVGSIGAPSHFALLGTAILFSAEHESAGHELWMMDAGTERAQIVKDINLVERGSTIGGLTVFRDRLLFSADDGVDGSELWRSDGNNAGTQLLHDLRPGESSSAPGQLTVAGDRVFFIADAAGSGRRLWSTDGSEGGAQAIALAGASAPRAGQLTAFGDAVIFNAVDDSDERALWRSDGTSSGSQRIGPEASHLAVVGTTIFMSVDGDEGRELWTNDGTAGGARLVKDIRPGSSGSYPDRFMTVGNHLFFTADDGTRGRGLWRSDGSESGTVFLAELDTDSELVSSGDALYFSTAGALWRADGGSEGARLVHEGVEAFAAGAGQLYFTADTDDYELELWKSDGTPTGTQVVRKFTSSWLRDGLEEYGFVKGLFVFAATNGFLGKELWRSDGTFEGTFRVTDLNPGAGDFDPRSFTVLNDVIFFKAYTPDHGQELWGYRP